LNWFLVLPGVTAVIARIAPFFGLIEITAARGVVAVVERLLIAFRAARWKRGSIVV
jgi:hypothetical protein